MVCGAYLLSREHGVRSLAIIERTWCAGPSMVEKTLCAKQMGVSSEGGCTAFQGGHGAHPMGSTVRLSMACLMLPRLVSPQPAVRSSAALELRPAPTFRPASRKPAVWSGVALELRSGSTFRAAVLLLSSGLLPPSQQKREWCLLII
eukprot:1160561-Pelagomonas_calceolata.AAC.6